MFWQIARFEIRYHLRQPLFWSVAFFFALLTFGATSSNTVRIGGAIGNVNRNAPSVVLQMLTIMSSIGVVVVVAFMASSVLRDFERKTHELFFSRPIDKRSYLLGRFAGSLVVSCLCLGGCIVGMVIGGAMPWVDAARMGPFPLWGYVYSMLVMVLPNFLFLGATFFALATLTRSIMWTYLGLVGFFVAYFISGRLLADVENLARASLLDPFGLSAVQVETRYWTIVERNSQLPALTGSLLANRLIWVGLGLALLAWTVARFRYDKAATPRQRKRDLATMAAEAAAGPRHTERLVLTPLFDRSTTWSQLLHQIRLETTTVIKSVPFVIILAFGLFNVLAGATFVDQSYGTAVYPVTHLMLQAIQGSYTLFLLIILILYSGEMIWRERTLDADGVFDALPTPNWVPLAGKLAALMMVVMIFQLCGVLATIGFQLYRGFTDIEPLLYVKGFALDVYPLLLVSILACFLQVVANSKFIGYLLMIGYLLSRTVLNLLDFQHNLYQFARNPATPYSDMNGYGHFLRPAAWFGLYWTLAAVILVGLSMLLWMRGRENGWRTRLTLARRRFRGPIRVWLPATVLAFAAVGAFVFYNTNVLNDYLPNDVQEKRRATYEKQYRQYKDVDMPRITAVTVDVDIFPRERRIEARGTYTLVNETDQPISVLHVAMPTQVTVNELGLPAHTVRTHDEALGHAIYDLATPLAPGAQTELTFDLTIANPGFRNHGSDTSIVHNGTFFNNRQYFPSLGYQEGLQLVDRTTRRKFDLEPVHRMAKVDDLDARRNTYIASDSDWIDFETTVSTSSDQVALAPGYLQREWQEDDRRYFHYKMDAPILHFYAFLSADYEVAHDRWNDVAIEIYHHPKHTYNVDRMIDGVKKSLDYLTVAFSPYQHRQLRIVEFPRYAGFAQSFPNTVPFSESIGFIARVKEDPDAIDYVFYVTAHEVAHQWWAHQVIGGNVQGSTLMSETMSQYAALMVMEKEYGPEKMRRFLKYELDRYLSQRAGELIEEMPLILVENQPYIHYRKGAVVMYALRDYLGEDVLNQAIRSYVDAVAFQEPPFTHSIEFIDYLRPIVPPEQAHLIEDLFETITLYENQAVEATYRARDDGRFAVTLTTKARKMRADGQGVETEIPIDDWIDVGVFGRDENGEETVLFLEKRRVAEAEPIFELVVDTEPVRAGIDPYNKLIDRNSDDNIRRVRALSEK